MKTALKSLKLIVLTLALTSFYLCANAQESNVEKSTFGLETGFLGLWLNNEVKLADQFALRTEIGLNSGILGGRADGSSKFVLTPVLTIEPRWYYNLNKRKANGKDISGNAGNFFSLKTSYAPDWFSISNADKISQLSQFSIIPTWGIRRNVGNHFYFETGIGVGYRHTFGKNAADLGLKDKIALNLHLRFGYKF